MCQAIPVVVTPEDGSFHPKFEEVVRAVGSHTKAIIMNSPNNPSGAVYSDDFVRQVVEFCEAKGIYLILDDIYHKLVFDGLHPKPGTAFTAADSESTRLIIVNGVAKLYGMTGFRIGWTIAPRELVRIMTNVQAQTTSCVSPAMQAAAEGALMGTQNIVESLRLTIQNNRDVLIQELRTFNGVRLRSPQGTFYALVDFRAYSNNSVELSSFLLKKALVVTVPGKEFGMEGHLRLSFAGTVKELQEAVARMKWALDPTSANEIYIGDRKLVRDWM
jgi:aspartate aminotransferase